MFLTKNRGFCQNKTQFILRRILRRREQGSKKGYAPRARTLSCPGPLYFTVFMQRMNMAAACALVALPCGTSVVSVMPVTMPFSTAQTSAS